MPFAAPKPCKFCTVLVTDGSERCPAHKVREGSFADRKRGSRHERGYGTQWDKARAETMQEQGGICQPCLRRGAVTTGCRICDHIVPKQFGGGDGKANRQMICRACNDVKVAIESQLARGLVPAVEAAFLASLTPPGVDLAVAAAAAPRGGQMSGLASARTVRQGSFSRAGYLGGGGT